MIVTSPTTRVCPLSEKPITQTAFLHCGHEFERPSISTWLTYGDAQCPVCRTVCSIREIADSPEEATEKAKQLAPEKLPAKTDQEGSEYLQMLNDLTFAQAQELLLKKSFGQFSSVQRFKDEDGNRIYQLFIARVFTKFVQNLDPITTPLQDTLLKDVSESDRERFAMGYLKNFVTHMTAVSSPLLLHALIEDNAMHEMIVPPAYAGLPPCECPVSSQVLAREYMLCERIQCLDRDVMLADVGIEVPDMPPQIIQTIHQRDVFPLGQVLELFELLPPIRKHYPDQYLLAQLNTAETIREFYPFWYERFQGHHQQQSDRDPHLKEELRASTAFTRTQIEFLLSALLSRTITHEAESVRNECSQIIEILEKLGEQIPHPTSGNKINITERLCQILADLRPAQKEESFETVHPKAMLYPIAQLRTELHAYWQFSDTTDYQQEWTDLQEKMKTQGHL